LVEVDSYGRTFSYSFDYDSCKNDKKRPADNERFGATAAGSADLKGSAGMPPPAPSRLPVVRKSAETVPADNGQEI